MRSAGASGSGLAPSQVEDGLSMDGTIQPVCQQVGGEGVARRRSGSGQDAHLGLGLGALAQDEGAAEGVDVLDADAGSVRDHLAPGAAAVRAERVVGSGQDAEVLGLLVGQDDEPAGAARRRREVVDAVLDALAAGQDDPGLGQRARPRGWRATRWCWCCAGR